MSIVSISDLHIKYDNDEADKLLAKFIQVAIDNSVEQVIFLGDIFEVFAGGKKQFIKEYPTFFDGIISLISQKIKVVYVEGNHDFHNKKLFNWFLKKNNLDKNLFKYVSGDYTVEQDGKKILFQHGDQLDIDNISYMRWKKVYTSVWMNILISYILPYKTLRNLGLKASKDSKNRSSKTFELDREKIKFRTNGVRFLEKSDVDILICGHTHIKDHYIVEGKVYINNGFPVIDRIGIILEWGKVKELPLV